MSYLLESLGRGLLGQLLDAYDRQLPRGDDANTLTRRAEQSPTSYDLAFRLGVARLREMRLNDATCALRTAAELRPDAGEPHVALACACDARGQLDLAAGHLLRAQTADPNDPAVAFGIGMCRERTGDATGAVHAYARAAELCPELRNAHERRGAIAVVRRDWDTAHEAYAALEQIEPDATDVLLTLANLDLHRGRAVNAIETFQRALLIEPDSGDDDFSQFDFDDPDDELAKTVHTMEKLVDKYPGMIEFRVRLADLYVKAGEDDAAVAQYRAALELRPGLLEATVKLGTQHLRRQRFSAAAHQFVRAVELNDRLLLAFVGLGVAQHTAGRDHDAEATFDLAISLAPNSVLLLAETTRLQFRTEARRRYIGDLLDDEGGVTTGVDECLLEAARRHEEAVTQQPNDAELHYRHGMLCRHFGDHDRAAQAFERAAEINPHYVKALIALGVSRRERGDADRALTCFEQAIFLPATVVEMHYELALLFAQRSRFDIALEQFELEQAGRDLCATENVSLALQNIGMVDRAAAAWQSIHQLTTPPTPFRGEDRFTTQHESID